MKYRIYRSLYGASFKNIVIIIIEFVWIKSILFANEITMLVV